MSRTRRILLFWAAAVLIASFESVLTAARLVGATSPDVHSSLDDVPACQAGMLLGTCYYSEGRPNPVLLGRIQAAAALYHAGKIRTLIVSGANSPELFYNETTAMKRRLIELGVPEEVIVEDDKGVRTLDSVLRMRDVFGYDGFITISQRGHCERALYLAARHQISTIGFEAEILPGMHPEELLFFFIRESLARIKAVVDIAVGRRAKYSNQR